MAKMNTAGLIHAASCTKEQNYKALLVALEQTNPLTSIIGLLPNLLSSSEYLLCQVLFFQQMSATQGCIKICTFCSIPILQTVAINNYLS